MNQNNRKKMNEILAAGMQRYLEEEVRKNKLLDVKRYAEMMEAKDLLVKSVFLCEEEDVHAEIIRSFGCGTLHIDAMSFEVCDNAAFCRVLEMIDNFEVSPLADGTVRAGFVFKNMLRCAEENKEGKE